MINFIFHGAGKEVGRSCIEMQTEHGNILFDAGLKITPDVSEFPSPLARPSDLKAILISHVHLDHTGALPLLSAQGIACPIYMSPLTKSVLPVLLKDSWKISRIEGMDINYEKDDISKILDNIRLIDTKKQKDLGNFKVTAINAGHIPGAQSYLVEFDDKKVIYTGDINLTDSLITEGLSLQDIPENIDILIIESTYGDTDHIDREIVEHELLDKVSETLDQGGNVLIPTFSIGRAQELIILLTERFSHIPIYLDGMAKKITELYLADTTISCHKSLKKAYDKIEMVEKNSVRKKVMDRQCIIVTTSGMLDGGPVLSYLPNIASDHLSSILLTGYQAEETNGRNLLEQGCVHVDGKEISVNSYVGFYDLSAHAGAKQLLSVVQKAKPKLVILNHGDTLKLEHFKKTLEENSFRCMIAENDYLIDTDKFLKEVNNG